MESCNALTPSATIISLEPLMKQVTAFVLEHSSITNILSLVVPNSNSLILPQWPNFSGDKSSKRGTIRPLVAIANNSNSEPPIHLIAFKSLANNKWLASSSNPHWHATVLAPDCLTQSIISWNFFCSYSCKTLNSSTVEISNLCLVLGFGGSNGHVKMAILQSLISLGI